MNTGPVRLRLLALPAVLAAGVATPAVAAPVTPRTAFEPSGEQVQASTATGSAKVLEPGSYRTSLPADETKRFFKLTRSPGEGLSFAIMGQPTENGQKYLAGQDQSLHVSIALPDGTSCVSDDYATKNKDAPLAQLLRVVSTIDPTGAKRQSFLNEDCAAATSFTVSVWRETPPAGSSLPVEIRVHRQPKIAGQPGVPATEAEASLLRVEPQEGGEPVPAGQGFGDAPTLPNGTVPLDLEVGQQVFYKVRAGYGQRVAASLEVPANDKNFAPKNDLSVQLNLWTPQGVQLDPGNYDLSRTGSLMANSGEAKTLGVYTPTIKYANRDITFTSLSDYGASAAWADTAGWYYVGVLVAPGQAEDRNGTFAKIPSRLSVRVSGQEQAGPTYVNAQGAALSQPGVGQVSTEGTQQDSAAGLPWWKIGVGALAVLAAAAACVWAIRARPKLVE